MPDRQPAYRVYEATQPGRPSRTVRVSVSASREKALREDISLGRCLLRLNRVLLETDDPGLALAHSVRHFQ